MSWLYTRTKKPGGADHEQCLHRRPEDDERKNRATANPLPPSIRAYQRQFCSTASRGQIICFLSWWYELTFIQISLSILRNYRDRQYRQRNSTLMRDFIKQLHPYGRRHYQCRTTSAKETTSISCLSHLHSSLTPCVGEGCTHRCLVCSDLFPGQLPRFW